MLLVGPEGPGKVPAGQKTTKKTRSAERKGMDWTDYLGVRTRLRRFPVEPIRVIPGHSGLIPAMWCHVAHVPVYSPGVPLPTKTRGFRCDPQRGSPNRPCFALLPASCLLEPLLDPRGPHTRTAGAAGWGCKERSPQKNFPPISQKLVTPIFTSSTTYI